MDKKNVLKHKSLISSKFSRAATTYDEFAFIQQEIGERLIERLAWFKKKPAVILDVGSGTGHLTQKIQSLFPKAQIIGLDLASGMSHFAKNMTKERLFKKHPQYITGDMEQLPIRSQSIDLVFSSCTLQWLPDLIPVFKEFNRVLKSDGVLLFSTFGPDTLKELKQSTSFTDDYNHVNTFLDMHDVGDFMLKSQLASPIVDMEMITLTYQTVEKLLKDLKGMGSGYVFENKKPSLASKSWYKKLLKNYEKFKTKEALYPASFEVIYGHAYKATLANTHPVNKEGVAFVPAENLTIG